MKGSILFNKDINIEVNVDPAADEGAKLTSAVNLVDGQELGVGGSDLPEVTTADNGKVLTVVNGEWAAEQKIFHLIYNEDENTFNLTPEQAFELLRTGVQIVQYEGHIDPEDTTTVAAERKEYINLYYDAAVYKLTTERPDVIVAETFTSPFYID